MRAALTEARKGLGKTSPNPAVGCVLVKGGKVIARGHHRGAGLPHAEVEALRKAAREAKGAVLYVNLEPCCHQGRTGPCTDAILAAKIAEVVVGMIDPNPLVNGQGIARLRAAGVTVRTGVLEKECRRLNEAFERWVTAGRPHVILKAAVSLDGRIAAATDEPRWISGEESRTEVHRMRAAVDAVLVGANTVLRDDPLLTTRLPRGASRTGRRVVLDAQLRIPASARVLAPVKGAPPTTVFTAEDVSDEREAAVTAAGAQVVRVRRATTGGVDLTAALARLAADGVTSVLVEGGAQVFTSFVAARAVDRVVVFVAPKLLGAGGVAALGDLPSPVALADVGIRRFGDDVMFEGIPSWGAGALRGRGEATANRAAAPGTKPAAGGHGGAPRVDGGT